MDLKEKINSGDKPMLRLDISNPSYKYITAKAAKAATGRKAQATRVFSSAKWAEGGIETIWDYTKTVYKDRGFDLDLKKMPYKEDGKYLLLYENKIPIEKNGESKRVPVEVVYNPDSKFNTYTYIMRTQKKAIDASVELLHNVVTLQIPVTTGMKKVTNFDNQKIWVEVGDIIWSGEKEVVDSEGRKGIQQIVAVPLRVEARGIEKSEVKKNEEGER